MKSKTSDESESGGCWMRRSHGKDKMSKGSEVDSAIGKLWAVIGDIIGRIRKHSERGGGGFDPEFLNWLAYKATDSHYDQAIGGLLNAWQAEISRERDLERMGRLEWKKVSGRPETYDRALMYLGSPGGFCLPTCEELISATNGKDIIPRNLVWVSRSGTGSPLLAFSTEAMGLVEVAEGAFCDVYLVRYKRKQLTVSSTERVRRIVEDRLGEVPLGAERG